MKKVYIIEYDIIKNIIDMKNLDNKNIIKTTIEHNSLSTYNLEEFTSLYNGASEMENVQNIKCYYGMINEIDDINKLV